MSKKYIKCLEINISEACNYKCNYCIFHRNVTKASLMDVNLAYKIASDYADYLNGRPGKIYLGAGEPTLNWEAIEEISDTIKSKCPNNNITISFMTNGSNITTDRIVYLKNRKIHMGLSIDGSRIIQNIQRPHSNVSIDTYDVIISVLEMAAKCRYDVYSLSATYRTPSFRKEVSHVIDLCKKYSIKELDLDYDIAALSSDTVNQVAYELFNSYNDITKEHINVFGYWIIPINNKSIEYSNRCYCGNSIGENICISANGQVKICGYDSMCYAPYNGFNNIKNLEEYNEALKQYKSRIQQCKSCRIKNYCFGQCIFMNPKLSAYKNNCKLLLKIFEIFNNQCI